MVKFAWGRYKLFLCLVSKLWFSLFVKKKILFWTTNINKDNIYCDVKGKICNLLSKFLHETLFPHPSILLIDFFFVLKIMELCDEFPQNIIVAVTDSLYLLFYVHISQCDVIDKRYAFLLQHIPRREPGHDSFTCLSYAGLPLYLLHGPLLILNANLALFQIPKCCSLIVRCCIACSILNYFSGLTLSLAEKMLLQLYHMLASNPSA
jgi:hypothetical protein